MKILRRVPFELHEEISLNHVVIGAAILESSHTDQSFTRIIRENLHDCAIHVLQKNSDGSVHNGEILQADFEVINDLIDDINLLEKAIQEDLQKIPNLTGVFFTKAKSQFVSLFD